MSALFIAAQRCKQGVGQIEAMGSSYLLVLNGNVSSAVIRYSSKELIAYALSNAIQI